MYRNCYFFSEGGLLKKTQTCRKMVCPFPNLNLKYFVICRDHLISKKCNHHSYSKSRLNSLLNDTSHIFL